MRATVTVSAKPTVGARSGAARSASAAAAAPLAPAPRSPAPLAFGRSQADSPVRALQ